jgi:hypothetical protein
VANAGRNTVVQLQAYILFDEFIGSAYSGSDPETIRRMFIERCRATYIPTGVKLMMDGRDITADMALACERKVDMLLWAGHSIASVRGRHGNAYFINTGGDCDRNGYPEKQLAGSPYTMVYGILRFSGITDAVYEGFVETSKKHTMLDGSMFYVLCIPQLLLKKSSFDMHELESLNLSYVAEHADVQGIPYPQQECGNCTFRSTSLGLLACMIDKYSDVDKCVKAFSTWMFEIFLYEVPLFLNQFVAAQRDLIHLLTQRLANGESHLAALGCLTDDIKAKARPVWDLLGDEWAKLHVYTGGETAPTKLPGHKELTPLTPLDTMVVGRLKDASTKLSSRDGEVLADPRFADLTVIRTQYESKSATDRQAYTNLYAVRLCYTMANWWVCEGRTGSGFTFSDLYEYFVWWDGHFSECRKEGDVVVSCLFAAASKLLAGSGPAPAPTLTYAGVGIMLCTDCMSDKHAAVNKTIVDALSSTLWGFKASVYINWLYEKCLDRTNSDSKEAIKLMMPILNRANSGANSGADEVAELTQMFRKILGVSHDVQFANANRVVGCVQTERPVHSSFKDPVDMTVFIEKMSSCVFSFGDIDASEDPFTFCGGINYVDITRYPEWGLSGLTAANSYSFTYSNTHNGMRKCGSLNTDLSTDPCNVVVYSETFKAMVQTRVGGKVEVEAMLKRYLSRLQEARHHVPIHDILYAVSAACYLWNIMGYDDPASMRLHFAENVAFYDFVVNQATGCLDPLRMRAVRSLRCSEGQAAVIPELVAASNDRVSTLMRSANDSRLQKLMPLTATMLPLLEGRLFDTLVSACADRLFDPTNPYTSLFHIMYDKHVHPRFLRFLDGDQTEHYVSSVVATAGGDKDAFIMKGQMYMKLSELLPARQVFKRRRDPYVRVDVAGGEVRLQHPIFHPLYVEAFDWSSGGGGYVGTPVSRQFVKNTQYCLNVTSAGVAKCEGEKRSDSAALKCGSCRHRIADVHELLQADAYVGELLRRASEFCYEEDVVVWIDEAEDAIIIDFVPYSTSVTIKPDGTMYVGASKEYLICNDACHWTYGIKNSVLLRKTASGALYLGVFERLIHSKTEYHKFPLSNMFLMKGDEGCQSSPFWTECDTNFHVIPLHVSGMTLVPNDVRSVWSYLNSCLIYKRLAVALDIRPMYDYLNNTLADRFELIQTNDNWPMMSEATTPKFHATLSAGESTLTSRPCFEYDDDDFNKLKRFVNRNSASAGEPSFMGDLRAYPVPAYARARAQTFDAIADCAPFLRSDTLAWIEAHLKAPCRIGQPVDRPGVASMVGLMREVLSARRTFVPSPISQDRYEPDAFYVGLPPCIASPLKLMLHDPAAIASYVEFSGEIRLAELMFYFIKGFKARDDQLAIVRAITEDLKPRPGGTRGRVHPMLMGSGKTAVVTPLAVIESMYSDDAPGVVLVVPPALLHQSAIMLARDVAPYSLVPVQTHFMQMGRPEPGMCHVMEDAVHKQLLVERAAMAEEDREDLKRFSYLFDEVDTLINPLTSELNIPLDTYRVPDTDLQELYMTIYNDLRGVARDDLWKNVPAAIKDHYANTVKPILRDKTHRQHFGAATTEEYGLHGRSATAIAVPFVYADTPVIGSKYSDLIFSMATTATCYIRTPLLPENVLQIVATVSGFDRPSRGSYTCDSPYKPSRAFQLLVDELGYECLTIVDESEVKPEWTTNLVVKQIFARYVVAPQFVLEVDMLNITGVDMITSGNGTSRSGFTGTPEDMPALALYDDDPLVFLEKRPVDVDGERRAVQRLGYLRYEDRLRNRLRPLLDLCPKARVLIDCGCAFVGVAPTAMFRKLVKIKGVDVRLVYWRRQGGAFVLSIDKDVPWDGVDDGKLFVYFAHVNTTGIDAQLALDTQAILTVGKDTRTRDFMQALFRMRKVVATQTCIVAVAKTVSDRLEAQNVASIMKYMDDNDAQYNKRQNVMLEGQCILAKYRSHPSIIHEYNKNTFAIVMDTVLQARTAGENESAYRERLTKAGMDVDACMHVLRDRKQQQVDSTNVSQNQQQQQQQEQEQEEEQDADIMQVLEQRGVRRVCLVDLVRPITIDKLFPYNIDSTPATLRSCVYKQIKPARPCFVSVCKEYGHTASRIIDAREAVIALTQLLPRTHLLPELEWVIVSEHFRVGDRALFEYGKNPPYDVAATIAQAAGHATWPTIKTEKQTSTR